VSDCSVNHKLLKVAAQLSGAGRGPFRCGRIDIDSSNPSDIAEKQKGHFLTHSDPRESQPHIVLNLHFSSNGRDNPERLVLPKATKQQMNAQQRPTTAKTATSG